MDYGPLVSALAEHTTRNQVMTQLRSALPESQDALLDGLKHGIPSVRRWSALVLDHAPHDHRIEEALQNAAQDRNKKVRQAAYHALSCAVCKPDGCLTTDGIGFLIEGLLHDRSARVRRACAGGLMWGEHGSDHRVVNAFQSALANDDHPDVRERAASFLARRDVPRSHRPVDEWVVEVRARVAELLAS